MRHFSSVFIGTLLLVGLPLQAQEPTFAGGVINITNVTRAGGASISLDVRQTFEADEPAFVSTVGAGGTAGPSSGSFVAGDPIYTLRSEQLLPIEYSSSASISAGALSCQNPQDICYGCITRRFSGPLRFLGDGLQNVDPNNRAYSVTSRYSVAFSNSNPAPRYEGPTFLQLQVGTFNDIDLKPFIQYGGKPYTCALKSASFQNGLIENPKTETHSMTITEDCRLRWNTESAVVGSKYAFQLAINSELEAQRPSFAPSSWGGCYPRTEVDFLLEIGCSETDQATGNPACFLCSDQNLEPTYAQIAADTAAWIANAKRNNRYARKLANRCNASGFAKRATAKWGKVANKSGRRASEALAVTTVAAKSSAGTCLAPSPFFCSSEDIRQTKDLFRQTMLELNPRLKRVARNSKSVEFEVKSCVTKKDRKRLKRFRQTNKRMLNIVLDTIGTLPDDSMTCGGPR